MTTDSVFRSDEEFVDLSNIESLEYLAGTPADLVLVGETGTGKDVVARAVHRLSRQTRPFVHVNCAAIPDTLMESELFGVEAGAYTGAVRSRPGKIEVADGGVLYLDEIDSMSLHHQAKLLNVLQYRGSMRLGGNAFRKSSFRLITSTKTPLAELVRRNEFRMDLFYRLNTLTIALPPLRNQPHRILPTFHRMLDLHSARFRGEFKPLRAREEKLLLEHRWPGNYRELLGSVIRRLCGQDMLVHNGGTLVAQRHTASTITDSLSASIAPLKERIRTFESRIIVKALDASDGNVAKAAAKLQMSPQTLHYRIQALHLQSTRQTSVPQENDAAPRGRGIVGNIASAISELIYNSSPGAIPSSLNSTLTP
jgi:transcriptional regulator with PAS, ATPase and Fis domain